jgi:hypothetical protein
LEFSFSLCFSVEFSGIVSFVLCLSFNIHTFPVLYYYFHCYSIFSVLFLVISFYFLYLSYISVLFLVISFYFLYLSYFLFNSGISTLVRNICLKFLLDVIFCTNFKFLGSIEIKASVSEIFVILFSV